VCFSTTQRTSSSPSNFTQIESIFSALPGECLFIMLAL
jgi:hypothetical protein